jgi:formylglycine-generating enzyme required for sulfatase activity
MPDRPLRVFLCHSSGDKPAVRDLYQKLKTDGFAPWLDEEELLPGQHWQEEIPAAVRACDVVIICLSQRSVSKEGFLQREIREALYVAEEKPEGTIFIIPVKLEEVEVPKRLSQWQWANLFRDGGYQRLVRALNLRASTIAEREAKVPLSLPHPPVSEPPAPRTVTPLPPSPTLREDPKAGTVRENPKDGLKYVWIPPGSFQMGCSPGDNECFDHEKPSHKVTIRKGFWIGQTQVTVGAYRRFAGATGRQMPPEPNLEGRPLNPQWGDEAMPIVNVKWDEAQAYCTWARGRLPTEAEWEYAARAGSTAARYGDLDEIAWFADNSGRERLESYRIWKEDQKNYWKRLGENGNGIHEVGRKHPNSFGLYDVLGNVWEWVNDWYDPNYYQNSPSQDPSGPASGKFRVLRGGSWGVVPGFVRVSNRDRLNPGSGGYDGGFRCGGEVFAP